jgi:transposase
MPKKRKLKRVSQSARAKILAEMKARGLTADQVAKKYRGSKWTVYGWRKRKGKTAARGSRRSGTNTKGAVASAVRAEIRAALPGILRKELARAVTRMLRDRRPVRRRRRAGKK